MLILTKSFFEKEFSDQIAAFVESEDWHFPLERFFKGDKGFGR
jgi:hypothetical protein